jgi:hypothetical protein
LGRTGFEKGRVAKELINGSGYIIGAKSNSNNKDVSGNHGDNDAWLIKMDNNGNIKWKKCFGGSKADVVSDVKPLIDGSFIVAGYTFSNNGDVSGNHNKSGSSSDVWVFQIDSSANIIWRNVMEVVVMMVYFLLDKKIAISFYWVAPDLKTGT